MVRGLLCVLALSAFCIVSVLDNSLALDSPAFYIETVVATDGYFPFITVDDTDRPWIGYWIQGASFGGTMHFAVRDGDEWSFETVPFETRFPVGIIIDGSGSPATAYDNGTILKYLHKSDGVWTTESVGGFGPNASALAVAGTDTVYAAYVWSYHYLGYISLSKRMGADWVLEYQTDNMGWFNPYSANIDLAIDGNGDTHICVNPIGGQYYYIGPSSDALPEYLNTFSIAVDSRCRPTISYTHDGLLRTATKDVGGWGSWDLSEVAGVEGCTKTDLVIDADDVPHIVYSHRPGGVPSVWHAVRGVPFDQWTVWEIDEGRAASVAVDSEGHLHVAYMKSVHDPPGWDILYATTSISTPVEKGSWGVIKTLRGIEH